MRVIGTAGHVDHGKSTLVKRLTGIDPDRLAEEKARQMTIDLGFAWMSLADGETIGIVDVPGHRDFIENMLAGIGGIDAVILVIAADEGVMPQTREHLAILDLLGIQHGIVALSKIDAVDDDAWLELIHQDIRSLLAGTALASAPILPVSAHTGAGIDALLQHLGNLLHSFPAHLNLHQPRLPIDRVFTVEGFGTVVTGTLSGGSLNIGDEVEIQPLQRRARVRGLQSYKQAINTALPGSRVAVNLSGIDKDSVERGMVLSYPKQLAPTQLADAQFKVLNIQHPLKHHSEVKFFTGSLETRAKVRLLADEVLEGEQISWLQLEFETPIPLALRDRFILRRLSPPETLGGGIIVNPAPPNRWRRFQAQVIADLQTRLQGTPVERLVQAANTGTPLTRAELQRRLAYSDAELQQALDEALHTHQIRLMPDESLWSLSAYQSLVDKIITHLKHYHQQEPLRLGMGREELRSRLGLKQALFNQVLELESAWVIEAKLIRLAEHQIHFSATQQQAIERLFHQLDAAPFSPPSLSDLQQALGDALLFALIERGDLVQVASDVVFSRSAYQQLINITLEAIDTLGGVDAKYLRDKLNSSRKYVIALLEHLDAIGVTQRVGDIRQRGARAPR